MPHTSPTYDAHVAWLREMNQRYADTVTGLASPSAVSAHSSGLPAAPSSWPAVHDEAIHTAGLPGVDISAQFDAVVLDDADFDAHVYRSFGVPDFDAFPSGSSSWAIDDFEEAPVYRSLSGCEVFESSAAPAAPLSAEEAERRWLAGENPPLLRRQQARGATFAL